MNFFTGRQSFCFYFTLWLFHPICGKKQKNKLRKRQVFKSINKTGRAYKIKKREIQFMRANLDHLKKINFLMSGLIHDMIRDHS